MEQCTPVSLRIVTWISCDGCVCAPVSRRQHGEMQAAWVCGEPNVWTFAFVRVVGNSAGAKVLQSTPQSSVSYRAASAAARQVHAWAAAAQAAGDAAAVAAGGAPALALDGASPRVCAWAVSGQAAGAAATGAAGLALALALDGASPHNNQASLPTQPLLQPPGNQGCAG